MLGETPCLRNGDSGISPQSAYDLSGRLLAHSETYHCWTSSPGFLGVEQGAAVYTNRSRLRVGGAVPRPHVRALMLGKSPCHDGCVFVLPSCSGGQLKYPSAGNGRQLEVRLAKMCAYMRYGPQRSGIIVRIYALRTPN